MSRTTKRDDKPFHKKWGNTAGRGKYFKRMFHKAVRRYYKAELNGNKPKSFASQFSEVSWRGW